MKMVAEKESSSSNAVNTMICEIPAEFQREKQWNSELMMRISLLESQLQHQKNDHHLSSLANEQDVSPNARRRKFKKFKKQLTKEGINMNSQTVCSQHDLDLQTGLVNWIGTDDDHFPNLENPKHKDSLLESLENSNNSDDGNDQDINGNAIERKDDKYEGGKQCKNSLCIGNFRELLSIEIKSHKTPFCPNEVTRILESKERFLKNAQSHTIWKIIVFASLGVKHGCEDMYELAFDHFKILQKGAPYESPKNPGVGTPSSRLLTAKSKTSKKQILPNHSSNDTPSTSSTPTQFPYVDFASSRTRAVQSTISQTPPRPPNFCYPNLSSYPIFPPNLASSFMPMMYWPPFTYQSFPSLGNYIFTPAQPLFTRVSSNILEPNMVNDVVKKSDNESSSSSSNTEPKET